MFQLVVACPLLVTVWGRSLIEHLHKEVKHRVSELNGAAGEKLSFVLRAETLHFEGRLEPLIRELQNVRGAEVRVENKRTYGGAVAITEVVLRIVSVTASLLTIADIIVKHLKRKRKTETDGEPAREPFIYIIVGEKQYFVNKLTEEETRRLFISIENGKVETALPHTNLRRTSRTQIKKRTRHTARNTDVKESKRVSKKTH